MSPNPHDLFVSELISGNRIRLHVPFEHHPKGTQGVFNGMSRGNACEIQFDGEGKSVIVPMRDLRKMHSIGQCVGMMVILAQNAEAPKKNLKAGTTVTVLSKENGRTYVQSNGRMYSIHSNTKVVLP